MPLSYLESRGLTLNRRSQADREGGKLGGRSQIAEANLISGDGFWCDPEFICHEGFGMHGKMANEDARSRVSAGYQQQNYETVSWRIDVVDHVRPHTLARLVASNRSSSHPQCQDLAQSSWGWARDRTSGPRKSGPLQTKFQTAIQVASLMDLRMRSLFAFPIHACTEKLTKTLSRWSQTSSWSLTCCGLNGGFFMHVCWGNRTSFVSNSSVPRRCVLAHHYFLLLYDISWI